MAGKPSDDTNKVMDVSKPGKGKIIINSRPIAAPVVKDPTESADVTTAFEPQSAAAAQPPSQVRKVIQPIGGDDDDSAVNVTVNSKPSEPESEPPVAETVEASPEPEEEQPAPETETTPAEPAETPASSDNLPTPNQGDESDDVPSPDESGAASVDEMAKAAESKRLAAQESKKEEERNRHVDELIASKQYYVKTSHAKHAKNKAPLFIAVTVLLVAIAGYLMADLGIFGDVKVPYEFFKESTVATQTTVTPATNSDQPSAVDEEDEANDEVTTPQMRGRDADRKTELKNLQQLLETYYSDNGAYPATLSDLTPQPTEAETTDASGAAYSYTSNEESYVLSALLENSEDPDADESGNYVLESLN